MRNSNVGLLLTVLIATSIPFPVQINSALIIVTFAYFFIGTIADKDPFPEAFKSTLSILIFFSFLVPLIGLTHTQNLRQGLSDIERNAFLITIILIGCKLISLNVSTSRLIVAFTCGTLIVTIYELVCAAIVLRDNKVIEVVELNHSYVANNIIHPAYLSVYLIFIFFFLVESVRTKSVSNTALKIGIVSILIFIVAILFALRSQMGLIIFTMLLVIYTIIVFKRRAWLVTFILFTVGLIVFLLDSNRVTTFFDTYGRNISTALDQRYSVWRGTIEGIKMSPIFGAGTGGEQLLINKGYAKIGYQEGIDNSYNAHNQYLQFLVRNGVLELGCFLALLFYCFKKSLEMPNYTFLMFNMTVTLIMLTESFLNVQKGIVFFYFFVCAFIFLPDESAPRSEKSILN